MNEKSLNKALIPWGDDGSGGVGPLDLQDW